MVMNSDDGIIYLYGGWDGTVDLADFWAYDAKHKVWNLLSSDTRNQGGPGPRSCHKIALDPTTKRLYVLGKYIDTESRARAHFDPDFFMYDIMTGKWTKISSNTAVSDS